MAQLSHDQFFEGVIFKNGNLIVKIISKLTTFITCVHLYSTKISFGDHVGADWGDDAPCPPLELSLVGGGIAPMLLWG